MRHYTILLIDYEPRSIERAKRPLTDAGFVVRLASDGIAGLSSFESLKPDLVIIEAMIPKKHGFEVCQEIKRTPHGKQTPVLIQTAVYKGRKYRSQALHIYGADDYLEKPYTDEFLVETVRTRLGIAPGEVIRAPEPSVFDSPAPEIEVLDPDRPAREIEPTPRHAAAAAIPHDPDHPADEEITKKLDDLFAMGDNGPQAGDFHGAEPVVATARRKSGARAATALASWDDDPAKPIDEGDAKSGELVDFVKHRERLAVREGRSPAPDPAATRVQGPMPPRGLPMWVWAGLVGGVVVLCYLVFSGTI